MPDIYIYWMPSPDKLTCNAIRKLHRLLDTLQFPPCFRHNYQWLRKWLCRDNQRHPNYQKAMHILNFLCWA